MDQNLEHNQNMDDSSSPEEESSLMEESYEVPEVAPVELENHVERHPVSIVSSFCTRPFGTQCERCLHVCPHNALSLTPKDVPAINSEWCTRCGLCMGICDAFCTDRITYADLVDKAKKLGA